MTSTFKKTILMVALDFPPCQSAGVQRTLKFAEYLAELNWQVVVLTVNEDVYVSKDTQVAISEKIKIYRCHSFDAARDFSIKGKYFAWSKVPDRWWTWAIKAIPLGKELINKYQPDIIWSTYPVSTAHFIAYQLQKNSNIPWVVDYRDPLQCRYDRTVLKYSSVAKWIEKKSIQNCTKAVFTTKRAADLYCRLYPDEQLSKFNVIENGFDENNFKGVSIQDNNDNAKYTLLHSGAIYQNGRDPSELFNAISELNKEGYISSNNFELVFRGANIREYAEKINQLNIEKLVTFKSNISYKNSLQEMASTSGLLLIQGRLFNKQIPGKAYEYIRCNKPILAITPEDGATGELLSTVEMTEVAEMNENIKKSILCMLEQHLSGERQSERFSRYAKTQQLDLLLRSVC